MNCRRVEEVIPLYVEGDLDAGLAARVSVHVKTCESCGDLARQYRESQDWLRANASPAFDDAFFERLRSGVKAEIEMEDSRPSFRQLVAMRWRWDIALAAAALLLVIGNLVFYAYQRRLTTAPSHPGHARIAKDPPKNDQPEEIPEPGERERVALEAVRRGRTGLREAVKQAVEPAPSEFLIEAGAPLDAASEIEGQPEVLTDDLPSSRMSDVTILGPAVEKTRIEIQTSDPTIRIIWFAPKSGNGESTRRSTDT